MSRLTYLRLALTNLRNNRRTYLPFLFASVLLTFTVYSFLMICFNPGMAQVSGGVQFMVVLEFGAVVVGLFAAVFLFYANSFLIKRRKKEMALYAVLGMEKRHVARVLTHELSLTWLVSMLAGLGLGVLLTRLLFLLIRLMMQVDVPLVGSVSPSAMTTTLILFAALFLLLILYDIWQVRAVSPAELLRGGQTGEREPRARWLPALLGIATTGAGYWIAQSVSNPLSALALFFVAVVLVIVGTYLLFLSGSIAVLKLLKRRKRYYYRAEHFVTVSGLLYRMKQNAAGLASIAILCTMAMVTLGTTAALYNGTEKAINAVAPLDMRITVDSADEQSRVAAVSARAAADTGVDILSENVFWCYDTDAYIRDGVLTSTIALQDVTMNDYSYLHSLTLMTQAQYAALEGEELNLAAGEIACNTTAKTLGDTLAIGDTTYTLRPIASLPVPVTGTNGMSLINTCLVVTDDATAAAVAAACDANNQSPSYVVQWNTAGTKQQLAVYRAQLEDGLSAVNGYGIVDRAEIHDEWYALYGGFLFVGIFLGLIFLMGTAMILYFKQISEGIQDHDRFIILQQVGMSPEEVKGTVRRQIMLVFFLPLLVAVCHVAGSLHMMIQMLRIFGLSDVPYIAANTFLSALGIAALYGLFYLRTARTYYNLVKF